MVLTVVLLSLSLALALLICGLAIIRHRRRVTRGGPRQRRRESTRLIVVQDSNADRLVTRPVRPLARAMARVLGDSLDRQLAAGRPPESSRLLAIRAQHLVSTAQCYALGASWEHLLTQPGHSHPGYDPHLPVCQSRVIAAEADIKGMLEVLDGPGPKAVRGVAMLRILLRRGDGPLFNRRCPVDLQTALREATTELDLSTALAEWAA